MCAASVIDFEDTTKDYGLRQIGPVTLSVKQGEVMGFLGPNGSGKTTCIRLLLGLMRPSSGSVRIRGLDPVSAHARALRGVGYSPELPNLQTFLTAREILSLTAKELGVPNGESRNEIKEILELVGLPEYMDVQVSKLSKGMVQRLSIAQAMIGSPDILVMDEPMIGLDPAGAVHFRQVFRDFAKQRGGTIFLSSHMMQEVQSLCTSLCMIHGGRILFNGSPEDVISKVLGSSYVVVEAEPVGESLIKILSEIPGVQDVQRRNIEGGRSLELRIQSGLEVRPLVSQAVISSGAKLYSIGYSDNLLERTYIKALGQES